MHSPPFLKETEKEPHTLPFGKAGGSLEFQTGKTRGQRPCAQKIPGEKAGQNRRQTDANPMRLAKTGSR